MNPFNFFDNIDDIGSVNIDPKLPSKKTNHLHLLITDLNDLKISNSIYEESNVLFMKVCDQKIIRGIKRKLLVFACLFLTLYQNNNFDFSFEDLIKIFKIKSSQAHKSLKLVNSYIKYTDDVNVDVVRYQLTSKINQKCVQFYGTTRTNDLDNIMIFYNTVLRRSTYANSINIDTVLSACILVHYNSMQTSHINKLANVTRINTKTLKVLIDEVHQIHEKL